MIFDAIFFGGLGALIGALAYHFIAPRVTPTAKAEIETELQGLGQIVQHGEQEAIKRFEAFAGSFDPDAFIQRIETTMSQAGDAIVQNLTDAASKIATLGNPAAVEAALNAEKADHLADLTNIGNAASAVSQAVATAAAPVATEGQ
jgi:hypothetical protein